MASSLWSARFFRQAQLGAGAVPRAAAAAAARMGDDGGGFWDNPLVELAAANVARADADLLQSSTLVLMQVDITQKRLNAGGGMC